jgi:hypothetical protein
LPRAVDFPQDVPAAEIRPAASLPHDPARDLNSVVAGKTDGRVVVIHWEDRTAKSQTSSNSGVSFTAESVIPTGPPTLAINRVALDFNLDNGGDALYALLVVADPGGDLGLQVVRSDDFGVSWGTPVDLVRDGDDTHGVDDAVISANSSGVVAVAYREGRGGDPYIRVSTNSGQTWANRVRLNAGVSDGAGTLGAQLWVEVDASGIVHAAFVENRGSGRQVFYTRSTNGGASFEAERNLDAVVGDRTDSTNPIIQSAFDGSLLLAFWDAAGNDHMYVLRSTDAGLNFNLELNRTFGNEGIALLPMLFASTASSTVVVHVIDGTGELTAQRSTDNGASYGPIRTLSGTAAPPWPSPTPTPARTPIWVDSPICSCRSPRTTGKAGAPSPGWMALPPVLRRPASAFRGSAASAPTIWWWCTPTTGATGVPPSMSTAIVPRRPPRASPASSGSTAIRATAIATCSTRTAWPWDRRAAVRPVRRTYTWRWRWFQGRSPRFAWR